MSETATTLEDILDALDWAIRDAVVAEFHIPRVRDYPGKLHIYGVCAFTGMPLVSWH